MEILDRDQYDVCLLFVVDKLLCRRTDGCDHHHHSHVTTQISKQVSTDISVIISGFLLEIYERMNNKKGF